MGGKGIKYLVDISGNLNSVIGPAPNYTPNPIYYGLLFLTLLSYNNPAISIPQIIPGTSGNIKAYVFSISNQIQLVLLNKDTSPNASGFIQVVANTTDIMQCMYLTAPRLNATNNISWAGLNFIGGSSVPQGNYTIFSYSANSTGIFNIPLNYSQATMCFFSNPGSSFNTMYKHELGIVLNLLLLIMIIYCI